MTDTNEPVFADEPVAEPVAESTPAPPPYAATPVPAPGMAPVAAAGAPVAGYYQAGAGPLGKIRGTGGCFGLMIVTLGIYGIYWYYKTSSEMKEHSGTGIGGGIALLLALFVGIVMPFLSSSEVGGLYERKGQAKPVSGTTGLWYVLLAWAFLIGPIVWFVKTNGALNDYWKSQGATA